MAELTATAWTYPDDDRDIPSEEITGVYRTRHVPTLGYTQHTVDGRFVKPETVRLVINNAFWLIDEEAVTTGREVTNKSYFEDCPRDEKGHCAPADGGSNISGSDKKPRKNLKERQQSGRTEKPTGSLSPQQQDSENAWKSHGMAKAEIWEKQLSPKTKHLDALISKMHGSAGNVASCKKRWEDSLEKESVAAAKHYAAIEKGDSSEILSAAKELEVERKRSERLLAKYQDAKQKARERQHTLLREHLQQTSAVNSERLIDPSMVVDSNVTPQVQGVWDKAQNFLSGLLSGRIHTAALVGMVRKTEPNVYGGNRSYHRGGKVGPNGNILYLGSIHLAENADVSTAVHEFGHHLDDDPEISAVSQAFLWGRVKDEIGLHMKSEFPNHGYESHEVGRSDEFHKVFGTRYEVGEVSSKNHPDANKPSSHAMYTGKFYKGEVQEVLSMGLQVLYENPSRLAKDPEYFKFVVGVLDGSFRK